MPQNIRHKRSAIPGAVPAANQLVSGELALNTADNKIYTLDNTGVVTDVLGQATDGNVKTIEPTLLYYSLSGLTETINTATSAGAFAVSPDNPGNWYTDSARSVRANRVPGENDIAVFDSGFFSNSAGGNWTGNLGGCSNIFDYQTGFNDNTPYNWYGAVFSNSAGLGAPVDQLTYGYIVVKHKVTFIDIDVGGSGLSITGDCVFSNGAVLSGGTISGNVEFLGSSWFDAGLFIVSTTVTGTARFYDTATLFAAGEAPITCPRFEFYNTSSATGTASDGGLVGPNEFYFYNTATCNFQQGYTTIPDVAHFFDAAYNYGALQEAHFHDNSYSGGPPAAAYHITTAYLYDNAKLTGAPATKTADTIHLYDNAQSLWGKPDFATGADPAALANVIVHSPHAAHFYRCANLELNYITYIDNFGDGVVVNFQGTATPRMFDLVENYPDEFTQFPIDGRTMFIGMPNTVTVNDVAVRAMTFYDYTCNMGRIPATVHEVKFWDYSTNGRWVYRPAVYGPSSAANRLYEFFRDYPDAAPTENSLGMRTYISAAFSPLLADVVFHITPTVVNNSPQSLGVTFRGSAANCGIVRTHSDAINPVVFVENSENAGLNIFGIVYTGVVIHDGLADLATASKIFFVDNAANVGQVWGRATFEGTAVNGLMADPVTPTTTFIVNQTSIPRVLAALCYSADFYESSINASGQFSAKYNGTYATNQFLPNASVNFYDTSSCRIYQTDSRYEAGAYPYAVPVNFWDDAIVPDLQTGFNGFNTYPVLFDPSGAPTFYPRRFLAPVTVNDNVDFGGNAAYGYLGTEIAGNVSFYNESSNSLYFEPTMLYSTISFYDNATNTNQAGSSSNSQILFYGTSKDQTEYNAYSAAYTQFLENSKSQVTGVLSGGMNIARQTDVVFYNSARNEGALPYQYGCNFFGNSTNTTSSGTTRTGFHNYAENLGTVGFSGMSILTSGPLGIVWPASANSDYVVHGFDNNAKNYGNVHAENMVSSVGIKFYDDAENHGLLYAPDLFIEFYGSSRVLGGTVDIGVNRTSNINFYDTAAVRSGSTAVSFVGDVFGGPSYWSGENISCSILLAQVTLGNGNNERAVVSLTSTSDLTYSALVNNLYSVVLSSPGTSAGNVLNINNSINVEFNNLINNGTINASLGNILITGPGNQQAESTNYGTINAVSVDLSTAGPGPSYTVNNGTIAATGSVTFARATNSGTVTVASGGASSNGQNIYFYNDSINYSSVTGYDINFYNESANNGTATALLSNVTFNDNSCNYGMIFGNKICNTSCSSC